MFYPYGEPISFVRQLVSVIANLLLLGSMYMVLHRYGGIIVLLVMER